MPFRFMCYTDYNRIKLRDTRAKRAHCARAKRAQRAQYT